MQPGRAFPWSALAKEVAVSTGSDEEFDGQQFKLVPVTAGGHRYVAWMAPLSMTIASVTAHLGGRTPTAG